MSFGFEGWERTFPQWFDLMDVAGACMVDPACFDRHREGIEFCWAISEECQEMSDYARDHLREALPALAVLATSNNRTVRWQVYAAMDEGGREVTDLLVRGLDDPDDYVRRRAALALAGKPVDVAPFVDRLRADTDPYIRRAAIELARRSGDRVLCVRLVEALARDPDEYVRGAVESLRNV